MEKRITAQCTDPHSVSLADRPCSLFIDSRTGAIFVDEGDGDGRMNGAVFSVTNGPSFAVRTCAGGDSQLVLDYRGVGYVIGVSADAAGLRDWAASANTLLGRFGARLHSVNGSSNGPGTPADAAVPGHKAV